MKKLLVGVAIAGLIAVLITLRAPAPQPDPSVEAQAIAGSIMSPFCPGLVLTACPSEDARELRTEIRNRLEAGEARVSIEADLVARYGQGVLADPSSLPGGRVAVLAPALVGFTALVFIALFVHRSTRRAAAAKERAEAPPDPEISERLDDELARLG